MRPSPAVVLSCLCVWLLAVPSLVYSQELPVTECAASPASLPLATEGVAYNASILTSTSPGLAGMNASNLPTGLALVGRYVTGTPTAPGSFSIGLNKYYRNGCGKPIPEKQTDEGPATHLSHETVTLRVRDTHAPTISGFTVTPETLGFAGGNVTLTVLAADNAGVTRILMTTRHPDGHSGSAQVPMSGGTAANGTWSITFALGGNATSAPVSYAFTISASDLDGNTSKAGPRTVVVAGHSAEPRIPLPLKRP